MNKLWIDASDDQIRDYILSQEGSTQGAVDGGSSLIMPLTKLCKS